MSSYSVLVWIIADNVTWRRGWRRHDVMAWREPYGSLRRFAVCRVMRFNVVGDVAYHVVYDHRSRTHGGVQATGCGVRARYASAAAASWLTLAQATHNLIAWRHIALALCSERVNRNDTSLALAYNLLTYNL